MKPFSCGLSRVAIAVLFLQGSILKAEAALPRLHIEPGLPGWVTLWWDSVPGTSYVVLGSVEEDPFAVWWPQTDPMVAEGTTMTLRGWMGEEPKVFLKLVVVNESVGLPVAQILSPTNSEVLSGTVRIGLMACDDARLSSVSLFLDGERIWSFTEGDLEFPLDTTHYANGPHVLTATAWDNQGISYLGGDPDSNTVSNQGDSVPVTVQFHNPLRWLDADVTFDSYLPILAESDIHPAHWNVVVKAEVGRVVRSFAGATINGAIDASWDGR